VREVTEGVQVLLVGLSPELSLSLQALAHLLEDIQSVARVPTLEEALEVSRARMPDVLLVEVPLQSARQEDPSDVASSMESLIQELLDLSPRPAIVALSRAQNEEALYQAVSVGAAAFLTLDTPPEFIISTIRRVYRGEQPIEYTIMANVALARQVLRYIREPERFRVAGPSESEIGRCPLSPRELTVLHHVAQGLSNKEIAAQMGVREQTVKNYVSAILRKTGASARAHAVILAMRHRWLTLD